MNKLITPITEDSINRVPKAIIFGNKLDKFIQEQAKEVLRLSKK